MSPEGNEMTVDGQGHAPIGGYVNGSGYLHMRLRMLLTGSNAPDEDAWAEALHRLLAHIAAHPVPGTPDERAESFAKAWGIDIARPTEALDERGERERDASHEIRMLDLDDDLIPLVQASDTPLVRHMTGRTMDTLAPVPGSFVLLAAARINDYDFAMDATVRFEDADGPSTLPLTLFGRRDGSNYEWLWADLSRRTPANEEDERERERIAGILHVVPGATIREIADDQASDAIESTTGDDGEMAMMQIVRKEDVVLTGDYDRIVFVMPVSLKIASSTGHHSIDAVYQGRIIDDMTSGSLDISSVGLRL